MSQEKTEHAAFGLELGITENGVPVYSSDYETIEPGSYDTRESLRSYVDGIYMGYKWQCVEFARRWCYLSRGFIFDEISMAYEIFELDSVLDVKTQKRLPLESFKNGCIREPEVGALLIWKSSGFFDITGHVAVIVGVEENHIDIAEQNVSQSPWPPGQHYSRRLRAKRDDFGGYWIACDQVGADIVGWVMQTDDASNAESVDKWDPSLFEIKPNRIEIPHEPKRGWLNVANLDEEYYVKANGYGLSTIPQDENLYFAMSRTAHQELVRATNELHQMFMHATHLALNHDEWFRQFQIPQVLWEKIQYSWMNRRNESITGRFDFCMTPAGLKLYEYNIDTSSCYLEAAKIQGKWAEHYGCHIGSDPGEELAARLEKKWADIDCDGILHIFTDPSEAEEIYHCHFMQRMIENAGIPTKIVTDLKDLSLDKDGDVVDNEGQKIRWIWKTWSWETAMHQIRQSEQEERGGQLKLSDVLLNDKTLIYEPLWSSITSNKALMAVITELYPDNPYILNTRFDVNDELIHSGYAVKPIAGRCGHNIELVESQRGSKTQTDGCFAYQENVYQVLCPLPQIAGYYLQISSFTVDGIYAGTCTRADKERIITKDSDVLPIRIFEDDGFRSS